eukprot:scaffold5296_cov163-Amphora_coffeaeformis.AAC.13
MNDTMCWNMLEEFAKTLRETSSKGQLDDAVYNNTAAKKRTSELLPCKVLFVSIKPELYGKVCRIWNFLAKNVNHDFVVLLGDDIRLLNK